MTEFYHCEKRSNIKVKEKYFTPLNVFNDDDQRLYSTYSSLLPDPKKKLKEIFNWEFKHFIELLIFVLFIAHIIIFPF